MSRTSARHDTRRIDLGGDDPGRALAGVVLAVVELLRQLLERQALRRVAASDLTEEQVERLGTALMTLEDTVRGLVADCKLEHSDVRALADRLIDINEPEGDR